MTCATLTRRFVALLALATPAVSGTIVVDDDGGPGVSFLDLPPAINAAQPGDLIAIHPGSYTEFSLHFPLTILALAPGVRIAVGSRVSALPAGTLVTLSGLELRDLRVLDCGGSVVLDGLTWFTQAPFVPFPEPALLRVRDSADVRAVRCSIPGALGYNGAGTAVTVSGASRLELVQCTLTGKQGLDSSCGAAGDGSGALHVLAGARVHCALTSSIGGKGGDLNATCIDLCSIGGAGDGGPGALAAGSTLLLMGSGTQPIRGGMSGIGEVCACDGFGGVGIVSQSGALVRYSGVLVQGGPALSDCLSHTGPAFSGPAIQTAPPEPTLELVGTPTSGTPVALRVFGPPGSKAMLHLGRNPLVLVTPGVEIEILGSRERAIELGTIPAGGSLSFSQTMPSVPKGSLLVAQVEVDFAGMLHRTNSLALVLR